MAPDIQDSSDMHLPPYPGEEGLAAQHYVGVVIPGNRIGRNIGFRTANVAAPDAKPETYGIYTTTLVLEDGRSCSGVSNLGVKPTVGSEVPLLEVHIFDFDEDIYGTRVSATLHDRLRPERKFESLEALRAQLAADVAAARQSLSSADRGGVTDPRFARAG